MTPSTLAVCGFSGSGKTTFVEKFIRFLIERGYRPGYVKHSGKPYNFDVPGKDTERQFQAGAEFTAIFSETHWSAQVRGEFDETLFRATSPADVFVLEGFKATPGPKIVIAHPEKGTPKELGWESGLPPEVFAYLTSKPEQAADINRVLGEEAAFHRDDLKNTAPFILEKWRSYAAQTPLLGAVLIGGKSGRMGQDKAWIDYGKGPQAIYLRDLLADLPEISDAFFGGEVKSTSPNTVGSQALHGNGAQAIRATGPTSENFIPDRFLEMGPMGGIASLFQFRGDAAWVVAGCDLACLTSKAVDTLLSLRDPLKHATLFRGDRLEPLLAIYEPSIQFRLRHALLTGKYSLQNLLSACSVKMLAIPSDLRVELTNANTPEEREAARGILAIRKNVPLEKNTQ